MIQKVQMHNVKKNQRAILSKDLPTGRLFGNKHPIKKDARGDITTEGFEAGRLKIKFYSHIYGTENVEFNLLSANEYLLVDV